MRRPVFHILVCLVIVMVVAVILYPLALLRFLPTSVLLSQQKGGITGFRALVMNELHERYAKGGLSASEATEMFDATMGFYIRMQSPHPKNEAVSVEEHFWRLLPPGCCMERGKREVFVDGRPLSAGDISEHPLFTSVGPLQFYRLPSLPPGAHNIEVVRSFTIRGDGTSPAMALAGLPYSSKVSDSLSLVIEDKTLNQYATAVYSEALAISFKSRLRLAVDRKNTGEAKGAVLRFSVSEAPACFAAMVEVRSNGQGEFVRLPSYFLAVPGEACTREYRLPLADPFDNIETLDVKLTPSSRVALDAELFTRRRYSGYFFGRVEWLDIDYPTAGEDATGGRYAPSVVVDSR